MSRRGAERVNPVSAKNNLGDAKGTTRRSSGAFNDGQRPDLAGLILLKQPIQFVLDHQVNLLRLRGSSGLVNTSAAWLAASRNDLTGDPHAHTITRSFRHRLHD